MDVHAKCVDENRRTIDVQKDAALHLLQASAALVSKAPSGTRALKLNVEISLKESLRGVNDKWDDDVRQPNGNDDDLQSIPAQSRSYITAPIQVKIEEENELGAEDDEDDEANDNRDQQDVEDDEDDEANDNQDEQEVEDNEDDEANDNQEEQEVEDDEDESKREQEMNETNIDGEMEDDEQEKDEEDETFKPNEHYDPADSFDGSPYYSDCYWDSDSYYSFETERPVKSGKPRYGVALEPKEEFSGNDSSLNPAPNQVIEDENVYGAKDDEDNEANEGKEVEDDEDKQKEEEEEEEKETINDLEMEDEQEEVQSADEEEMNEHCYYDSSDFSDESLDSSDWSYDSDSYSSETEEPVKYKKPKYGVTLEPTEESTGKITLLNPGTNAMIFVNGETGIDLLDLLNLPLAWDAVIYVFYATQFGCEPSNQRQANQLNQAIYRKQIVFHPPAGEDTSAVDLLLTMELTRLDLQLDPSYKFYVYGTTHASTIINNCLRRKVEIINLDDRQDDHSYHGTRRAM